jgi:Zn-dependent protease with chaperone function
VTLLLSSVLLGLMWFAATNAVASLLAWLLGRSIVARAPKRQSVRLLLAIRLLPAAASSLFVLAVFLPAHWSFEPPDTEESFGVVLAGTATLGLLLILLAGWRAIRAGFAGHRFAEIARRAARQVDPDGVDHQVLELKGLRGISLAGIWRPKIFIGPEALAALTSTELDLAIAHEIAHRQSNDNLKRLAMCCAPDFFGRTSVARQLEQQWQAEAECDADAHAVRGDDSRAVALASALVKVARLERVGGLRAAPPAFSAFHVPTLLELRVRRLVAGSAVPSTARGWVWQLGTTASLVLAAGLWLTSFSHALHVVTEALVAGLP